MLRRVGIAQVIVDAADCRCPTSRRPGSTPSSEFFPLPAPRHNLRAPAGVRAPRREYDAPFDRLSTMARSSYGPRRLRPGPRTAPGRAWTRLHRRARRGPVMTATSAPAAPGSLAVRPEPGAHRPRRPSATARAASQRDVVAAPAGRRAVLFRLPEFVAQLPMWNARHGLQNAAARPHHPGDGGRMIVSARTGGRSSRGHGAAALGSPAGHLGRDHSVGRDRRPGLHRRGVRG